jgi:hypothetical protein
MNHKPKVLLARDVMGAPSNPTRTAITSDSALDH